jgi:predicted outer membrane repeat protein
MIMFFFSWLRKTTTPLRPSRRAASRPRFRPAIEALEDRSVPAVLNVTTTLDVVDPNDGLLSLREAIQQADPATAGGDTIVFDGSLNAQTIVLNGSSLLIDRSLNIEGPGADLLSISGNRISRVFSVSDDVQWNVSDLTIRDGKALSHSGGGISNHGGLVTVRDCIFTGNSGWVGGIYNTDWGQVTVSGSVFSNNFSSIGGGAIRNNLGILKVSDSVFSDNWTSLAPGGAIYNSPNSGFTLSGCSLTGNTAWGGSGGAIYNSGSLTISGCVLSGNSSIDTGFGRAASGGAIYNGAGQASLQASTLTGNIADHDGGAIWTGGSFSVSGCTLSDNDAMGVAGATTVTGGSGGGIFNRGNATISSTTLSDNSALVSGGGIYTAGFTMTINSCTLSGNSAAIGGGLFRAAASGTSLTLTGCTISANSADIGGGVYNAYASKAKLTISDSTITGNTTSTKGGGLYNNGAATIQNTTISGNSAGEQGGGIFNDSDGVLTLYSSSTVTGNLAPDGADIYNLGRVARKKG